MDSRVSANEAIDDYIRRGWSIIPIRTGDKRPLVRWHEFQHRRPSVEEVRAWFSDWPEAGIGIVTGAISDLVVLDIDSRHGGDASMERLEQQHDRLPATVECRSGGGGRHLYFAHPGRLVRNKVGLAPGVDLRGDGGYVVAPPSLHASGQRYSWVADRTPDNAELASLSDWVLRPAVEEPGQLAHPIGHWRRLVREGVREGERNNTIASLAGHLAPARGGGGSGDGGPVVLEPCRLPATAHGRRGRRRRREHQPPPRA